LAQRCHPAQSDRRIAEVFAEERPLLRPLTAAGSALIWLITY